MKKTISEFIFTNKAMRDLLGLKDKIVGVEFDKNIICVYTEDE